MQQLLNSSAIGTAHLSLPSLPSGTMEQQKPKAFLAAGRNRTGPVVAFAVVFYMVLLRVLECRVKPVSCIFCRQCDFLFVSFSMFSYLQQNSVKKKQTACKTCKLAICRDTPKLPLASTRHYLHHPGGCPGRPGQAVYWSQVPQVG